MSDKYAIINDDGKLREFIDWLPDCESHEQFYVALFIRKKYCPDVSYINSDHNQCKRFVSRKDYLFDKIRQLECTLGAFKLKGKYIPQQALALYILPNPRDMYKAAFSSISQLAKNIQLQGKQVNPYHTVMTEIHRTPSTKRCVTFDIDEKNDKILQECLEIVDHQCDATETRGGYHVHVHRDKIAKIADQKGWYNALKKRADVTGDCMTPVVGCCQGDFTPKFVYRYKEV